MKRILSITKQMIADDSPDTSFIGEFTDEYNEWAIDRASGEFIHDLEEQAREQQLPEMYQEYLSDCERDDSQPMSLEAFRTDLPDSLVGTNEYIVNGYRYSFDGWEQPGKGREYRYFLPYAGGEKQGTEDYQKYGKQDSSRMESLARGDWNFVGVKVKAIIRLTNDGPSQEIESAGLWGIESDAGDYLDEVAKEELGQLSKELEAIGFSKRTIKRAIAAMEQEFSYSY